MSGTERWSLKKYREYMGADSGADRQPKQQKYRSKPCMIDGIRFDSKIEAAYYLYLEDEKADGGIDYYQRQVPFHLPGGIRYVVDFQVVTLFPRVSDLDTQLPNTIATIEYVDVKGTETPIFTMKKKQVEELYPIKIRCVRRADIPRSYIKTVNEIVEASNGEI